MKKLATIVALGTFAVALSIPIAATTAGAGFGGCNPNYDPCVPNAQDQNCGASGGAVTYPVNVIGEDEYGLDRDGNGVGCQNETGTPPTAPPNGTVNDVPLLPEEPTPTTAPPKAPPAAQTRATPRFTG